MKKFTVLVLSLALVLVLIGCETKTKTYSGAPKIVLRGQDYYSTNLSILNKLPDGYLYAGKLTNEEKKYSNITRGYNYYIKVGSETIDDFYVYQEVDNSSGEWAYVKWSDIKNN